MRSRWTTNATRFTRCCSTKPSRLRPTTPTRNGYTQVWFAGVHSNVGGGYPDDSLARVPLRWMADEAGKKGLRLHPIVRGNGTAHADPQRPAQRLPSRARQLLPLQPAQYPEADRRPLRRRHDRRGRRSTRACSSASRRGATTMRPSCCPIDTRSSPATGRWSTVTRIRSSIRRSRQSRCADQERVWNQVFLRRIVYFATIAVTLALLVPPFIWTPEDVQKGLVPSLAWRAGANAIQLLDAFVPDSLQPMTDYYYANPTHFAVLGALLAVLMSVSWTLQRGIQDRMRLIWAETVKNGPTAVIPHAAPTDLVYRWRTNRHLSKRRGTGVAAGVSLRVWPAGSARARVDRQRYGEQGRVRGGRCLRQHMPRYGDRYPDPRGAREPQSPSNSEMTTCVKRPAWCWNKDRRMPFASSCRQVDWSNGGLFGRTHRVDTTAGFSSGDEGAALLFALPFRRVLTVRWFVPIARIGMHLAEYHPLDQDTVTITPRRSGQLFLFVNDAIPPWPFWTHSYVNNTGGSAAVTITRALASGTAP